MSHEIRVKATYAKHNLETEFIMPQVGSTIDINFDGKFMFEAENERGNMIATGRAMDGYGSPVVMTDGDIIFKVLN